MYCPLCSTDRTATVKVTYPSRDDAGMPFVGRRHLCKHCGCTFETFEKITKVTPKEPKDANPPKGA